MAHSESLKNGTRYKSALWPSLLLSLLLVSAGCDQSEKQEEPSVKSQAGSVSNVNQEPGANRQPDSATKPLTDLESLVAPIALYPDALLAEILVASTYPLEVVQAARWLETNPDPLSLNGKNWDASVMRLATVPDVIGMMNKHIEWTTQLGDTFLVKPAELMDAIQTLRKRAKDAGFLKDTPEQKVSQQIVPAVITDNSQPDQGVASTRPITAPKTSSGREVITIQPMKEDTLYVPQYNPEVVYQAPLAPPPATIVNNYYGGNTTTAPAYYPVSNTTDTMLTFATGALVGGLLTWGIMEWAHHDDYYVGHYYGNSVCHHGDCWHGGGYRGDINYNKNVNINISDNEFNRGIFKQNNLKPSRLPETWRPDPVHRRGQDFPPGMKNIIEKPNHPALAGQRPSTLQALPASARGLIDTNKGLNADKPKLPSDRRLSSTEIRDRLAQKPGSNDKLQSKQSRLPQTKEGISKNATKSLRENALQSLKTPGQVSKLESKRGLKSRKPIATKRPEVKKPQTSKPKSAIRPSAKPQTTKNNPYKRPKTITKSRPLATKPNAFENTRNAEIARNSSKRGATSRNPLSAGSGKRSGGRGAGLRR